MISDGHDMTEKLLKVAISHKTTIKTLKNMLMSLATIILFTSNKSCNLKDLKIVHMTASLLKI